MQCNLYYILKIFVRLPTFRRENTYRKEENVLPVYVFKLGSYEDVILNI